ncbi:hypothetical protein GS462_25410 [Rhodococcus hoagii]|nr:hypothetical protein [Prescottella equi]MBM4527314.1 hypothetical protein [Prescottella equi]MBM4554403.1 hypothetical protein [Prescottella equi]MBM4653686.1 hypothetical protein [Prescottella equi]MBM4685400.1 hypothetical protein [Prescottella equi]
MLVVSTLKRSTLQGLLIALIALLGMLIAVQPAAAQESSPAPTSQEAAPTDGESTETDGESEKSTLDTVTGTITGALDCAKMLGNTAGAVAGWLAGAVGAEVNTCGETAGDVMSGVTGKIGDAAQSVAEGAVEKTALSFGNAGAEILKFALGWWITFNPIDTDVFTDTVSSIGEYTFYIQVAAFALSMILLGARLAMARSGAIRDTSEEGFRQMARATLVAGTFTSLVVLGTRLSDGIANWFMEGTVGEDPRGLVEAMVSIAVYAGPGGTALLFVIGLLGILGGLVMAFLMLMRTGFLVLMAAALPIAGAAGGTKIGSQAFDKMIAWTIAWLLVKPVGAFVIGCSAMLFLKATPTISNPDNGDALMALTGVILLCAAALVLPSLMRMIVPNVGALGGGGSGAAAGAALGALAMKGAGMMAGGGAPTGAAVASSSSTTASTSASGGDSGMTTGAAQPAPASFSGGGDGGQQPGGTSGGNPNVNGAAGGNPGGSEAGTPTSSGAAPASGDSGGRQPVSTGAAAPQFNSGGFER